MRCYTLKEALGLYEQAQHVNSDELRAFVQLSEFLIRLRLAIIANKWFDDGENKPSLVPLKDIDDVDDFDSNEDEDAFGDEVNVKVILIFTIRLIKLYSNDMDHLAYLH